MNPADSNQGTDNATSNRADAHLDLRGTPCPINFVRTKLRLEQINELHSMNAMLNGQEEERKKNKEEKKKVNKKREKKKKKKKKKETNASLSRNMMDANLNRL